MQHAKLQFSDRNLLLLLLAFAAAIAYGSLVPLQYRPVSWDDAVEQFRDIRDLDLSVHKRADWVANLLLFIPLGFLGALLVCRRNRSLLWRLSATTVIAMAGMMFAVALEFTQIWFPPRTVSQNDIRAEAIGSCVGALFGLIASIGGAAAWRRVGGDLKSLRSLCGPLYLAALGVYSLMPGDLVLSRDEFLLMLERGGVCLTPFSDMEWTFQGILKRAAHVSLFLPVGFIAVDLLRKRRSRIVWATAAGVGVALVIEAAQLGIFSRNTSVTALFFAGGGAWLGAFAHREFYRPTRESRLRSALVRVSRHPLVPPVAVAAYVGFVFLIMLFPFELIEDPAVRSARWTGLFRVPFEALYYSTEFGALTSIMKKGLLFAVFGALLQLTIVRKPIRNLRPSVAATAAGVIAAMVGTAVEIAQVFVAAHQPDGTDVMIYTAFAVIGSLVCDSARREGRHAGAMAEASHNALANRTSAGKTEA